jgi:hypothetical protein
MSKAGAKIIAALEEAAAGEFARVTVKGQAWVPETPLHRAAPRLLKELRRLVDAYGYGDDKRDREPPMLKNARAAIAKAEGR